jgi:hypothetical protein
MQSSGMGRCDAKACSGGFSAEICPDRKAKLTMRASRVILQILR